MTPSQTDEDRDIERLLREDREKLSRFVERLNRGLALDDMEPELKTWWLNRY